MKNFLIIATLIGLSLALFSCAEAEKKTAKKPNVIYILADDLGYAELGCYGQEKIETPNIDKLASTGMRFTNHYSGSAVCAPSRCVLLTGKHTGHSYIRGNDEWNERGDVWDYKGMIADPTLEGQRPIPADTETIGKMLQREGYKTACIGKWGLGAPETDGTPNKQGFDFFVGYNCQRMAHTYYPVHLWMNDKRVYQGNDTLAPHTKLSKDADPLDPASYDMFTLNTYSPDVMIDEALKFIDESKDEPFFLYFSTPIPHAPLAAPKEWVDKYITKFGDEEPSANWYYPVRNPHATYAAMVSYLDHNVGQLMAKLKELGLDENTLVIFTSDNGPTFNGGSDSPWFDSAKPFKSEAGWGKCYLREGGIRVPMIASWKGVIKPNTESNHKSAFWDVMPTLAELSGATVKGETDGLSFLPTLLGKKDQAEHDYLYWEFGGAQALQKGDWKIFRPTAKKNPEAPVELYNLKLDQREQHNVAKENPELVKELIVLLNSARTSPKEDFQQMWEFPDATN